MEIIYTKNNKNIIEYLNDIESARARYNLLLKEYGNSISAIFLTTSLDQPNSMSILPDFLEEPNPSPYLFKLETFPISRNI